MTNPIRKINNTELYVVRGDITRVSVDAIMTAINSEGLWFGGIDGAIQRVAGNIYHAQASAKMPLEDGQIVIAKGDRSRHRGEFNDVVFVVDDLQKSLDKIIYEGLSASSEQGYKSIALPAIRMGVMAGIVEKTPREAVNKIGRGVANFMSEYYKSTNLTKITFVIYSDDKTQSLLENGFTSYSFWLIQNL